MLKRNDTARAVPSAMQRLWTLLRMSVAAALLMAAITPQALAQTHDCGPVINQDANVWGMVGIPCDPGANNTVADVFSQLGAANYNVTWVLWRRTYDDVAGDQYVKLAANSEVFMGEALWLYTTQAIVNLQYMAAGATPGPSFILEDIPKYLGSPRDFMVAGPYSSPVNFADFYFNVVITLPSGNTIPRSWTTQGAVDRGLVQPWVFYWDDANKTYFTLDLATATFSPKQSAWIEMAANSGIARFAEPIDLEIFEP